MKNLSECFGSRLTRIGFLVSIGLVVAWVVTQEISAQVLFGTIKGVVRNVGGQPVPKTLVTLLKDDEGIRLFSVVGDSGEFVFLNLRPGIYTLRAAQPGFKTAIANDVIVFEDNVTFQTLTVQEGLESQSDNMALEPAPMRTVTSDIRVRIGKDEIVALPLPAYRNYQSLINFVPGATPGRFQDTFTEMPARSLTTNFGGTNRNNNVTKIDGVRNVDLWRPHHTPYVQPSETIEVFNVTTNSFDAEQGFAGGSAITILSKSGSNAFHGSIFGFHENDVLNARDHFNLLDADGDGIADRSKHNRTFAGGTIGGPAKQDEVFFFAGFEGVFEKIERSSLETVPTLEQRTGDFSSFGTRIYDPMTGNPDGTGRVPFENNVIPLRRIDPSASLAQDLLPLPNLDGLVSNYDARGTEKLNRYNVDLKADWNRLANHRIWGKFSWMDARFEGAARLNRAMGGGFNGEGDGDSRTNVRLFGAGHSWTVTPSWVVDTHFGFTDFKQDVVPADLDLGNFGQNSLRIPGTNSTDDSCNVNSVNRCGGIPAFFVTGFSGFGQTARWNPLYRDDWSVNVSQNVSWLWGDHDLRFGYDLIGHQMDQWQLDVGGGPRGSFTFNREMTSVPGAITTDQNAWAAFLLGFQSSMGKTLQWDPFTTKEWQHGLYVRDRWQALPGLTVTLGLRWEYYPMLRRLNRPMEHLDLETFQVVLDNSTSVKNSLFAPQVGVAYRVTTDDVIRGGYGVNYNPLPFSSALRGNYPLTVPGMWEAPNPFVPFSALEEGIPIFTGPDLETEAVDLPQNVMQRTLPSDRFIRGLIQSWNLVYEHRLPSDMVVSLGYVGSKTLDQSADRELNWARPGGGTEGRQLYPMSATSIRLWDGWLEADYNAFQAALNQRFRNGFSARLAYTYSKAMNMTDDDGPAGLLWNDPELFERNRAVAGYNRPHMLQLAAIYQLPSAPIGNGLADMVVRNWQFNGWFSFYSNAPFTVTGSSATLNAPGNVQTADQISATVTKLGGVGAGDPYYDPSTFAAVTRVPGVDCSGIECYGTSGRNVLYGPSSMNLDLAISRVFKLTEGIGLEFRSEFFNLTNTAHFLNPNGDVNSSSFMTITRTDPNAPNRVIRVGLRIRF